MPKAPANADRDRTIGDLLSAVRTMAAQLDTLAAAINQHARLITALQQQVGALALESSIDSGERRYAQQA